MKSKSLVWLFVSIMPLEASAENIYHLKNDLEVYPAQLKGSKTYEIGDLLESFIQPKGVYNFTWDHMSDSGILWLTDGVDVDRNGVSYRSGIVRVNINNQITTVLKSKVNELGWSIDYMTKWAMKWGPEYVLIEPGFEGSLCFGSIFTQCSFDIDQSLNNMPYKVSKICNSDSFRFSDVYKLSGDNIQPLLVVVSSDGGSGGATTQVMLTSERDPEDTDVLCGPRF